MTDKIETNDFYNTNSTLLVNLKNKIHQLTIKNKQPTSGLFQYQYQREYRVNFSSYRQISNMHDKTRMVEEAIEIEKQLKNPQNKHKSFTCYRTTTGYHFQNQLKNTT